MVPAGRAAPDSPHYRVVHAPADEGPAFLDTLQSIADFYIKDMGGRVRDDGPGVKLKWSRDWGYPWVFTRAAAAAGSAVLDCGAGNSPMPYLMARQGASVIASTGTRLWRPAGATDSVSRPAGCVNWRRSLRRPGARRS